MRTGLWRIWIEKLNSISYFKVEAEDSYNHVSVSAAYKELLMQFPAAKSFVLS